MGSPQRPLADCELSGDRDAIKSTGEFCQEAKLTANQLSAYRYSRKVFLSIAAAIYFAIAIPLCTAHDSKLAPEKRAQIEAAVSRFMATTHIPGLSVGVVENGEYEWARGFGFADLENNVPASEHTLFRLGSISKPLTATAAMQLWERGKLDLDAPVQKYCPVFPQKPWPISSRQVLGHLAGIRHYKSESQGDVEAGNTKHFGDPIQAGLNFFKDDPLIAQPGTSFHYSTQGYTLVGCVMEGAAGTKYVDLMRQNVFVPAQMEETQADDRFAIIPYRTRFYQKKDSGAVLNADFLDSSYKIPGGGWLSSAEDMAKFSAAILNDKLIRHSTRDVMWTPLKPTDGGEDTYGLGWGWGKKKPNEVEEIGHTGGQQGTSTAFVIAPEQRAAVVVLTNLEDQDPNILAKEILNILCAAPGKKP
jgi:serine beta-lactamase-like protein LACTB, mitochondrial